MTLQIVAFDAAKHTGAFEALNTWWLEEYFYVEPGDKALLADPQKYIIEPGGYIWLAELDGEIVGTISLIKDGDTYEISKMAVHPKAQGRGIAHQLIRKTMDEAARLDVAYVYLLTSTRLETANYLYRKFGMVEVPPSCDDRKHYARCDTRWEYYFADREKALAEANVG